MYEKVNTLKTENEIGDVFVEIQSHFNALADVEKHYQRKEYLLFPFLEEHDVTGPPHVMWGNHDESRELVKTVFKALHETGAKSLAEANSVAEMVFLPA